MNQLVECWYEKFEANLKSYCCFALELNMKFLERQWYFKGEALAKHPMGKCAKSIDQSSLTPLVCEWSTHDTDFHPSRKWVLVEEENFCGESIVSQIGVLGNRL